MRIVAGGADCDFLAPVAVGCLTVETGGSRDSYHIRVGGIAVQNGAGCIDQPVVGVMPDKSGIAGVVQRPVVIARSKDDHAALFARAAIFGQVTKFIDQQLPEGSKHRRGPQLQEMTSAR